VMKTLYRPGVDERPLAVTASWRTALIICVVGMILLGVVITPMFGLATVTAGGWF